MLSRVSFPKINVVIVDLLENIFNHNLIGLNGKRVNGSSLINMKINILLKNHVHSHLMPPMFWIYFGPMFLKTLLMLLMTLFGELIEFIMAVLPTRILLFFVILLQKYLTMLVHVYFGLLLLARIILLEVLMPPMPLLKQMLPQFLFMSVQIRRTANGIRQNIISTYILT